MTKWDMVTIRDKMGQGDNAGQKGTWGEFWTKWNMGTIWTRYGTIGSDIRLSGNGRHFFGNVRKPHHSSRCLVFFPVLQVEDSLSLEAAGVPSLDQPPIDTGLHPVAEGMTLILG